MIIHDDVKLDYKDVLLVPKPSNISSRLAVKIASRNIFSPIPTVPIIAANMDGVGTFKMAKVLAEYQCLTALNKHYNLNDLLYFYMDNIEFSPYFVYSMGMNTNDLEKFVKFESTFMRHYFNELNTSKTKQHLLVPFYKLKVCIDVANGYQKEFEDFCLGMRTKFPRHTIIAGNVATPEQTERLFNCGVDVVKVGIGPGSVCTTRSVTGVGYPQFSAVVECSRIAKICNKKIIADGGCTEPGDVVKALAAGADMVMLGGMLAGHDEGEMTSGSDTVKFYGMASEEAQKVYNNGLADYRSSEGKSVRVPYRGKVENTIKHILGGIRSGCSYVGVESVDDLNKAAEFVRVNRTINNIYGN